MTTFDRINGVFIAHDKDTGLSTCEGMDKYTLKRAGWSLHKKTNRWHTVDIEAAIEVERWAIGSARLHIDHVKGIQQDLIDKSWAADSDIILKSPDGLNYLPFQKAGIEYALNRANTLIADAPGLGKTVQAVGIHNNSDSKRILVVCPASLKINWSREWLKWDIKNLSVGIPKSKSKTKTTGKFVKRWTEHVWPDTDVVIVNYDQIEAYDEQIKAEVWDLVIYDEAHLLKSTKSIRTKCVFGGRSKTNRKDGRVTRKGRNYSPIEALRAVFLTGTPVLSKPVDLWNIVKKCDPFGLGRSYDSFTDDYCDGQIIFNHKDVSGASNLEKLNKLLRMTFMVRRDKKEVLKDLPPKTREVIILPQDGLTKVAKKERTRVETALNAFEAMNGMESTEGDMMYLEMIDSISDALHDSMEDLGGSSEDAWAAAVKTLTPTQKVMFTEISLAREEVALAKVKLVAEHVLRLYEAGEPVILFAYHSSVIKALQKALESAGLAVGVIGGWVGEEARQKAVDDFQAGLLDVILGNIIAMGVGYTLTHSSFVVFAEIDWVPALVEQAEDRAWRIGQKRNVTAQHLVVDGSVEAAMTVALIEKMEIIRKSLDERK